MFTHTGPHFSAVGTHKTEHGHFEGKLVFPIWADDTPQISCQVWHHRCKISGNFWCSTATSSKITTHFFPKKFMSVFFFWCICFCLSDLIYLFFCFFFLSNRFLSVRVNVFCLFVVTDRRSNNHRAAAWFQPCTLMRDCEAASWRRCSRRCQLQTAVCLGSFKTSFHTSSLFVWISLYTSFPKRHTRLSRLAVLHTFLLQDG